MPAPNETPRNAGRHSGRETTTSDENPSTAGDRQPLVPEEVDLSGLAYMPLYIARLRCSKAWLVSRRRPEIFRPMLAMWMRAWQERPAGSLEADDDVLADAAELTLEQFQAARSDLLRGWILCQDGRLYHPAIATFVMEAWPIVLRGKAGAAAKWRKHRQSASNAQALDEQCKEVKKEEKKEEGETRAPARNEQPAPKPATTATCCSCTARAVRKVAGSSYCEAHAREQEAWAAQMARTGS